VQSPVTEDGKNEHVCAEDIVVYRESRTFHGKSHNIACAGRQTSPAHPYRPEEGGTRWEALEPRMGPDHREGAAARNAFFAGPQGRPSILPAILRDGHSRQTHILGLLFQALAGAEAGLNPNTSVRHTEPEVGLAKRSEGLLQLAYADQKRYGCDFNWQVDRALKANDPAKTILQPKNNLECGVKILFNQTIVQHKPLLTRSSYWSTLRPGGPSYRVFAKQMTNPPSACGLSTKSRINKSTTTKSVQDSAKPGETPK
jgi:hypothetical protein